MQMLINNRAERKREREIERRNKKEKQQVAFKPRVVPGSAASPLARLLGVMYLSLHPCLGCKFPNATA